MSAREDKGGVIQRRATAEVEDEIEALEALRFAQGKASLRRLPVTAVVEEDANALEIFRAESNTNRRESMDAVARRLAIKVELMALAKLAETMSALPPGSGNVTDSFITVPPTVASVPVPDIPPAPRLPSIADGAADQTLRPACMTPAFVAATAASRGGAVRGGTWAVLLSMVAIAVPGGLLIGEALISHPATARSAHPPAVAPTAAQETDAVAATTVDSSNPPGQLSPGTSTPNANTAWSPVDPQLATRKPHTTHHAKGKAAPKPSPNPAASSAEPAPSPAASTNDPSATSRF
jgi:hypothetical protein